VGWGAQTKGVGAAAGGWLGVLQLDCKRLDDAKYVMTNPNPSHPKPNQTLIVPYCSWSSSSSTSLPVSELSSKPEWVRQGVFC